MTRSSGTTRAGPERVTARTVDDDDARALVGGDVGRMWGLGATSPLGNGRQHQGDSQMSQDFHPTGINVYGYAVAWVPAGATSWTIEMDED